MFLIITRTSIITATEKCTVVSDLWCCFALIPLFPADHQAIFTIHDRRLDVCIYSIRVKKPQQRPSLAPGYYTEQTDCLALETKGLLDDFE